MLIFAKCLKVIHPLIIVVIIHLTLVARRTSGFAASSMSDKELVDETDSSGEFVLDRNSMSPSSTLIAIVDMVVLPAAVSPSSTSPAGRVGVVSIDLDQQTKLMKIAHSTCSLSINSTGLPPSSLETNGGSYRCPPVWDGITCWPATEAGQLAVKPCPNYVNNFRLDGNVTRQCREDGTWYFNRITNRTWSNYTDCFNLDNRRSDHQLMKKHMGTLQLIYRVGYSLSLISMIIAVTIMLIFKKLRCFRNTLHVNLFISFILRATMALLRDFLMDNGIGLSKDMIQTETGKLAFNEDISHWECRLLTTLFNYTITANYAWIFVEGLYLHTLLFVAVFSENSGKWTYITLGWTGPLLFVIPWAIVRAVTENELCWNTHPTPGYFWIIKGPIMVTIILNFCFFINIIFALFNKLRAFNSTDTNKHRLRKLAKSALVLIPLFGVPYIVFLGVHEPYVNETTELAKLYFEMTFNSFNGFFVSLLYCFLNGEVQSEITKRWYRYRLVSRCSSDGTAAGKAISSTRRMTTTISNSYMPAAGSTSARTTHGCNGNKQNSGRRTKADFLSTSPATTTYNCSIVDDVTTMTSSWAPNGEVSPTRGRARGGSDVSCSEWDNGGGHLMRQDASGRETVEMKRLDK